MGKVEFSGFEYFGLKTSIPPEIKGRSSGAQFGPESSVHYLSAKYTPYRINVSHLHLLEYAPIVCTWT